MLDKEHFVSAVRYSYPVEEIFLNHSCAQLIDWHNSQYSVVWVHDLIDGQCIRCGPTSSGSTNLSNLLPPVEESFGKYHI